TFLRQASRYQALISRLVAMVFWRLTLGRLAYCWRSKASSASKLAISAESCSRFSTGALRVGWGLGSGLGALTTCCGCGFGVLMTFLTSGVSGVDSTLLSSWTCLTSVSWNGALSVVLGTSASSKVPLPC